MTLGRGDRIKYTPAHLAWLRESGLWPVKAWAKPFFGTVLETEEDRVRVEWDAGRPWPRKLRVPAPTMTWHLAENLEVAS